jgi:hypothetical protein
MLDTIGHVFPGSVWRTQQSADAVAALMDMDGDQRINPPASRRGQRFIRQRHVGKLRVAAAGK